MAKATSKTPAKKVEKKPAKKAAAAPKAKTPSPSIEKAAEGALKSLQALNLDSQLQSDLEWCLGSYKADSNPMGLYEMVGRAVSVLASEKQKKTKGVTAKMISDLESVLKGRP